MAIDPATIVWDDEPPVQPQRAQAIDPSTVVWDDTPITDFPTVNAERPTDSMSTSERFAAGVGKSLVDTGKGAQQFLADMPSLPFSAVSQGVLGVLKGEGFTRGMVNGLAAMGRERQALRDETAERRELDRDLTSTGAGMSGNVIGTIAQMLGPGIAARGTLAAPALLPATIRGNALQGASIGALQPNTGAQDRGLNMLLGGVGGAAGAGLVRLAGATSSGLRNLLGRTGLSGTDRRAAEILAREATAPQTLTYQQSAVPGVRLTLGESTQDPGLMALENAMRARNRGAFEAIDQSNNAARVSQLGRIAGNETDMAAAIEARDAASSGLRDAAFREGDATAQAARDRSALMLGNRGDALRPLREQVSAMSAQNASRPSVQAAVRDVDRALENAGDSVGSLYKVRQYVGDLLEGKAGGDKGYAKAASRELMQIRDALDEQLAQRAPSFPEYLQAYRQASRPINRMEVGREVLQRSSGAVPDQLGNPVLTPAGVMRATGDLDAIAAKATGFKKAQAAEILSPEDIGAIRAIQDDMVRQASRQRSGTVGSQTAERLAIGDRIAKQSLATRVPWAGQFFEHFEARANEQLQERLAFMMANPQEAKRVLAALPERDRAPVRAMLGQLAMASGRSSAAQQN
jgi:hypothetical protein